MNLQLVPKYKKYNKTLNQVFYVSVPPSLQKSPGSYAHDLPVPIKIEPYKQKKQKNLRIQRTPIRLDQKDSYDDSEKGCGLSRWCRKRKALKNLQTDHIKQKNQAEQWRRWKYQEAERLQNAEIEQARQKREAEYAQQLYDIQQQKRLLAKNTLKTRYTYLINKRSPGRELPKNPYYPQRINYSASDDYLVVKSPKEQKRDLKRIKKEEKQRKKAEKKWEKEEKKRVKNEKKREKEEKKLTKKEKKRTKKGLQAYRDTYNENVTQHKCKCSKFKSYLYNFKKNNNKPYTDPYETYYDYDKPSSSLQRNEDIKPYEETYNYDKTTKIKYEKDDISEAELNEQYNKIYGAQPKKTKFKKVKKSKKRKDTAELCLGKCKPQRTSSQKFVNCFYRTCCECYCWLSIFIIIGFAIIMFV